MSEIAFQMSKMTKIALSSIKVTCFYKEISPRGKQLDYATTCTQERDRDSNNDTDVGSRGRGGRKGKSIKGRKGGCTKKFLRQRIIRQGAVRKTPRKTNQASSSRAIT